MAGGEALREEDFGKGFIEAPLRASRNFDTLVLSMDRFEKEASKVLKVSDAEAKSINKVVVESAKLEAIQNELTATQAQLAEVIKKLAEQEEKAANSSSKLNSETKKLKMELKAAENEAIKIARTMGTNSEEFRKAAEKAGALRDELADVKDAIKNVEQSKFENLSTQLGNVSSKLLSLDFGGALAAARQFAATMKTLTFAELIAGGKEAVKALALVGRAILTSPIGILAATLTAIGYAFVYMKEKSEEAFAAYLSDSKKVLERAQEQLDLEIEIAKIRGQQTFDLEKKKQEQFISGSERRLKFLKAERDYENASVAEKARRLATGETSVFSMFGASNKADLDKQIDELESAIRKASNELILIEERRNAFTKDLAKKRIDEEAKLRQALNDFLDKLELDNQRAIEDRARKGIEELEKLYGFRIGSIIKASEIEIEEEEGVTDEMLEQVKKRVAARKKEAELRIELEKQVAQFIFDLAKNYTAQEADELAAKSDRLKASKEEELRAAGDNEEAKYLLNKKYAEADKQIKQEQLQLKRRQAVFDKVSALFSIGINTATAIGEQLPGLPFTAGTIALIKAIAAVQVAGVLAAPLPKYAKGTLNARGGLSIINEEGPELIEEGGKARLYDTPGAVITSLKPGARVYTAAQTRALARRGFADIPSSLDVVGDSGFLSELRGLRRDFNNKREVHINIGSVAAVELVLKRAESRTKFLSDFYA